VSCLIPSDVIDALPIFIRSHDQIQSLLSENTGFTPFTYMLHCNSLKEAAEEELIQQ